MRRRRITETLAALSFILAASVTVAQQSDDPFADAAAAPAAPAAPAAAAPAGPTTAADASDPFAESAAPPAAAAPDTLPPSFGAAGAAEGDPFAAPVGAAEADPFAAPAGAAPPPPPPPPPGGGDPFGAAPPPPPPGGGDPFGAPPAGGPNADPFAPPLAPAGAASAPAADPFAPDASPSAEPPAAGSGNGISQLYQFRFLETERPDGSRGIVRKRMTKDEAEQFDQTILTFFTERIRGGQVPSYNAAYDAGEWAQWMSYAYQVKLWQTYVEKIVLAGAEFEEGSILVQFPGDPPPGTEEDTQGSGDGADPAGGSKGGGTARATPRPTRPANIYNENRSLDDQTMDFVPFADTRSQQGQQRVVIDPKQMDDQTRQAYQTYITELRSLEEDQQRFMAELKAGLDQRAASRAAYKEWRDNQVAIVKDFVNEWNRRYEGQVTTIAGVRYELYRPDAVPAQTSRGANIVITDYDLTPYDLLNEDGTLRGPSRQ